MEFYLWSIFFMMVLVYAPLAVAKSRRDFDNSAPRPYMDTKLKGKRQRAYWAHQNGLEVFPFYAAAILLAHIRGVDPAVLNMAAMIFIVSRILYIPAYIYDTHKLRSLIWAIGFFSIVGLFVIAA